MYCHILGTKRGGTLSSRPEEIKIYHITHIDNLSSIVEGGGLWSESACARRQTAVSNVGISEIKARRLQQLRVSCHPGTKVGDYVPFYFCPRSIMLFLLHRANHPGLTYHGGQGPIIHLRADFNRVVEWADEQEAKWAFSDRNAGMSFARFSNSPSDLGKLDWQAIGSQDFQDPEIKEGKQAEFLVFEIFPWPLVEMVGVCNSSVEASVREIIAGCEHQPEVRVRRDWYYY